MTIHEPTLADAMLHPLVDQILDTFVAGECEPSLFHVIPDGDSFLLGALPLGDRHPGEVLSHIVESGITLPDEWWAIGFVTGGLAQHIHTGEERRVAVVTFVSRSNEIAHRVHGLELDDDDAPAGDMIDIMRAALNVDA